MTTAHIISHSHWDREWYLPFESHHVKLVELMDALIDLCERDPEFRSFHLDGQTIVVDDYLEIRPERAASFLKLAREGRLVVGPWYILQDEFLVSGEATVRNLQAGLLACERWGIPAARVGYFPDAFGNIGQAPQLLKQAGIDVAVFGRGVKPTGANNRVSDSGDFESPFSEMVWQSPDGSRVVGVLFSNWYNNGMEVPVDPEASRAFWTNALVRARRYASTNQLLFMNGCDHQPVQTDLTQALAVAGGLEPEVEFRHSDFPTYIENLRRRLPDELQTVRGELRSQHTDGLSTLVNTASSRVYLKQANQRGQTLLEKVAEPLATLASIAGQSYPHHLLDYSWKLLMQNHPHDSICGCSVDSVHREMMTRFEKSLTVAEEVVSGSAKFLGDQVNTEVFFRLDAQAHPFVVFNTTEQARSGTVTTVVETGWVPLEYENAQGLRRGVSKPPLSSLKVVNCHGDRVEAYLEDLGTMFDYDLPKDRFRQPRWARKVRVTLAASCVPPFGYTTYALVRESVPLEARASSPVLENYFLHGEIGIDGTLTLRDKRSGRQFVGLGHYEDTGDVGNEYTYVQPAGTEPITTRGGTAVVRWLTRSRVESVCEVTQTMRIPTKADYRLEEECKALVSPHDRRAGRGGKSAKLTITTRYTLEMDSPFLKIETSFNNRMGDHRIRALVPTSVAADSHFADSVFEVVTRPNRPAASWRNPSVCHHQQAFVGLEDRTGGLLVGNKGLSEYEILEEGTIAITLLRSVGEMGDWGYFPTPGAQCQGPQTLFWTLHPFTGSLGRLIAQKDAYQIQVPWTVIALKEQKGPLPPEQAFLTWEGEALAVSSLKASRKDSSVRLRLFNMTNQTAVGHIRGACDVFESDILETEGTPLVSVPGHAVLDVAPAQIQTVGLRFGPMSPEPASGPLEDRIFCGKTG
jgi:alpha-mannosidase